MRTRILSIQKLRSVVVCLILAAPAMLGAQDKQDKKDAEAPKSDDARKPAPFDPRVTPMGTQRPKPVASEPSADKKQAPPVAPAVTLSRAANAHGGKAAIAAVKDSVAIGTVTFFGARGASGTHAVQVTRKGGNAVERVIHQESGDLREVSNGTSATQFMGGLKVAIADGPPARFIASQTGRSIESLLDADAKGLSPSDAGEKDSARVLEVREAEANRGVAKKTRFYVDNGSSKVTRIEFETGETKDMFGKAFITTESFVYSDFRTVQGVPTPFHVERFVNGAKTEDTQFTSVKFNNGIKDEVFK